MYYELTVHSIQERDDWFWKAMEHFRAAEALVDPAEWHAGARRTYEALKEK